jgi:hypothetical protein
MGVEFTVSLKHIAQLERRRMLSARATCTASLKHIAQLGQRRMLSARATCTASLKHIAPDRPTDDINRHQYPQAGLPPHHTLQLHKFTRM